MKKILVILIRAMIIIIRLRIMILMKTDGYRLSYFQSWQCSCILFLSQKASVIFCYNNGHGYGFVDIDIISKEYF